MALFNVFFWYLNSFQNIWNRRWWRDLDIHETKQCSGKVRKTLRATGANVSGRISSRVLTAMGAFDKNWQFSPLLTRFLSTKCVFGHLFPRWMPCLACYISSEIGKYWWSRREHPLAPPTLLLLLRGNIPSLNGNGHYKSRCLFIHSGKFNIATGPDWVDVFPIKHVMFQPAIFIYQRVMSLWISYFKMQDSQPRIRLQVGSVEASFHWRSGSIEYKDFLPGTTGALGWAGTLYIVGENSSLRVVHVIFQSHLSIHLMLILTSRSKSSMNLETIFAWNAFWEVLLLCPNISQKRALKTPFGIQDGDFHHLKAWTFAGVLGRNPGQKVREPSFFFLGLNPPNMSMNCRILLDSHIFRA